MQVTYKKVSVNRESEYIRRVLGVEQKIMLEGRIKEGTEIKKGYIIADVQSGLIEETGYGHAPKRGGYKRYSYDDSCIISRGDLNCHSHPEQSLYVDIVDKNWDLPTWCRNTIYKYSPLLKPEFVYLACCRAFIRMLKLGVTSVMVSFYCHNRSGNTYDRQVIKAAEDTGIRIYFGRMNYDIIDECAYEAKKNSQKSYFENASDAEKNFVELLNSCKSRNAVIAPSVHSIHASSMEAIVNAINLGNRYDRYVQFHMSEDRGDVDLSLKLYGMRPVEFLVDLVKSGKVESLKNMILSDCVWIDDHERELIKEYGMGVVLNPRMNHRIKTGEAQLDRFIESGIYPFLGTDGEASNDDLSIEGERNFLKERFRNIPGDLIDSFGTQPLKFNDGYIGGICAGNYCDIKVTKDGIVNDVFVGGRIAVSQGRLFPTDMENDVENKLNAALRALNAF